MENQATTNPSAGRSRGRSRFGGRGTGRGRYQHGRNSNNNGSGSFGRRKGKGDIDDLGDNIFDIVGGGTPSLFEKTSRKLAGYVGTKFGGSIRYAVENLQEKQVVLPPDLDDKASEAQKALRLEEIRDIAKEKRKIVKI